MKIAEKHSYRQEAKALTVPQAAYLAGILDGEGCFSVLLKDRKKTYIRATIEVASTSKEFLEDLQQVAGVGVVNSKKKRNPKAKQCHVWTVPLCSIKSFLDQVSPYLRLKNQQAEIFSKLVSYEYPSRIVDNFQILAIESMRTLNKRGVHKQQSILN